MMSTLSFLCVLVNSTSSSSLNTPITSVVKDYVSKTWLKSIFTRRVNKIEAIIIKAGLGWDLSKIEEVILWFGEVFIVF